MTTAIMEWLSNKRIQLVCKLAIALVIVACVLKACEVLSRSWIGSGIASLVQYPSSAAFLAFGIGSVLLIAGTRLWLTRIDRHPLLSPDEKLQNKDALVIAAYFVGIVLMGLCVAGAAIGETLK